MANKHLKRCLTSLLIRAMTIKILRYSFTSSRMAGIKISDKCGENAEKSECWCTDGGNVQWCSCFGKQSGRSSIKHRYCYMT